MAMTVAGMKAAMLAKLTAAAPISTPDQLCDALADAIVNYIKTNAVVTINPGAPTTCGAGAGTVVSGTGTVG